MRAFLIALSLAALAAIGYAGDRILRDFRQQQRAAEATAAQAGVHSDLEARATAGPDAPAPPRDEAVAATSAAAPVQDDDDDDEAYIREVLSQRSLTNNCLVCHGEAMFSSQRLTPAQWKAEIDKMLGWGAVIPEDEREMVEEYLAKHYGPDSPPFVPDRIDLAAVESNEIPGDPREGTADADPARGAPIFQTLCAPCHGPNATGTELCPALANRAVLTHFAAYDKQVNNGLRRMPSMHGVIDAAQQRDILGWLRSLPYDQPPHPDAPGARPVGDAP